MINGVTSLKGKILLAMPGMGDPRFHKSSIFMVSHDGEGAMGISINQPLGNMVLGDLYEEIGVDVEDAATAKLPVLMGGPVDTARGFLLHSADYNSADTIRVNDEFGLSGTLDTIKSYAKGTGPHDMIFALGYSGWGPGQLEQEILANAWLIVDADYDLLFNTGIDQRWEKAMSRQGIDPSRLSSDAGHA